MAKRILLYSHDTVGLGHIRRVAAIGRKLALESPDHHVLILTGSPVAGSLQLPPNVDYVKLPSVRKVSNSRYVARSLGVDRGDITALRSEIIREAFEHFEPDVFVVDKAPLGVNGDLRSTLEYARAQRPECRIVLSLRDILDEPDEVIASWEREGIHGALRRFYDRILVWGEERVFDLVREYRLPDDIADKVTYCGYIGPETFAPDIPRRRGRKKLVLVTVGGGQDGFRLLDQFVRCLPETSQRFASVVLTGPELPPERRAELLEHIGRHDAPIFTVDYTRHVDRLMRAADLVVAMAGYNTMCEIVSGGRPAIVVPRTEPRREQLMRAARWEALGLLRMVHPDHLTPSVLARAIDEELGRKRRDSGAALDFGGLERAAEILVGDFNPEPEAGRELGGSAS